MSPLDVWLDHGPLWRVNIPVTAKCWRMAWRVLAPLYGALREMKQMALHGFLGALTP